MVEHILWKILSFSAVTQNELYASSVSSLNEQMQSAYTEKTNYENLLASSEDRVARLKKVLDIVSKDEYIEEVNKITSYKAKIAKLN